MLYIKEIAKKQNITLKQLAERIGVTPPTLSTLINRNNLTYNTLSKLANALNVPICSLFVLPTENIGNKLYIKEILKNKNITLKQLAERIGVTQPTLSHQLSIKSNLTTEKLNKIAIALDMPIYQLFINPVLLQKNNNNCNSDVQKIDLLCPYCKQPIAIHLEKAQAESSD